VELVPIDPLIFGAPAREFERLDSCVLEDDVLLLEVLPVVSGCIGVDRGDLK